MKKDTILKKKGMTLVEIVIAMGLLSLLAVGLLSGTLQTRKITEENIYQQAAQTAIVGYLEQTKSIPYTEILESISDPAGTPLATVVDDQTADPLFLDTWNYKTITINTNASGNPIETMDLWVNPTIEDLSAAAGGRPALAIRMAYRWKSPATRQLRESNIKIVRSSVVTF